MWLITLRLCTNSSRPLYCTKKNYISKPNHHCKILNSIILHCSYWDMLLSFALHCSINNSTHRPHHKITLIFDRTFHSSFHGHLKAYFIVHFTDVAHLKVHSKIHFIALCCVPLPKNLRLHHVTLLCIESQNVLYVVLQDHTDISYCNALHCIALQSVL